MEHDLVGINEIAALAGVTSQAVTNWRARSSDFPSPLAELASGPVFRKPQIRAWLKRNNRKLSEMDEGSNFYPRLKSQRNDDEGLAACIDRIVTRLEANGTSGRSPGMLLGKIQSGKTRAFVGVIAKAFDRGFDIALVLTKGTKTLSAQTVRRLSSDFKEFIADDEIMVLDIMNLPTLKRGELRRKIVVVAKKQSKNLERLINFMQSNQGLQNRKVLLIDDEADLASVRFVRDKGTGAVAQGTIAGADRRAARDVQRHRLPAGHRHALFALFAARGLRGDGERRELRVHAQAAGVHRALADPWRLCRWRRLFRRFSTMTTRGPS